MQSMESNLIVFPSGVGGREVQHVPPLSICTICFTLLHKRRTTCFNIDDINHKYITEMSLLAVRTHFCMKCVICHDVCCEYCETVLMQRVKLFQWRILLCVLAHALTRTKVSVFKGVSTWRWLIFPVWKKEKEKMTISLWSSFLLLFLSPFMIKRRALPVASCRLYVFHL